MRINAISFKSNSASNQKCCPSPRVKADSAQNQTKTFAGTSQVVDKKKYDLAIAQIARLNALNLALIAANSASNK